MKSERLAKIVHSLGFQGIGISAAAMASLENKRIGEREALARVVQNLGANTGVSSAEALRRIQKFSELASLGTHEAADILGALSVIHRMNPVGDLSIPIEVNITYGRQVE